MNVLAIDTACETLGICIRKRDGKLIHFSAEFGWQHSTQLLPWIDRLLAGGGLKSRDLDLIVCSRGPGSFTGLRIGLATAKGLATGLNCPLVGISTLEALAYHGRLSDRIVVPVIDARKKRIFTAFFKGGKRLSPDRDISPEELVTELGKKTGVLLTGPMASILHPRCPLAQLDPLGGLPVSANLAELGLAQFATSGGAGPELAPLYLRKSEAELKLSTRSAD